MASGLTPSTVNSSLADLPMRWAIITSWLAAASSAGAAPCCSLSADTVSAASDKSDDRRLMKRSPVPTWVMTFCCASMVAALFCARSTMGVILSSSLL
jgi:hypothetical protein